MKNDLRLTLKGILLALGAFAYNMFVYYGGRFIAKDLKHYCLATSFDYAIPFVPWMILIYFGCYLTWIVNYPLCMSNDKGDGYRFFLSHVIGEGICFLCFVTFPTVINRPECGNANIFEKIITLTYCLDAPDNLFPSIHCFLSQLCWIGVRRDERFPKAYRVFMLISSIVVCVTTLTVKQHVIADVAAGVLLAEFSNQLSVLIERRIRTLKNRKH